MLNAKKFLVIAIVIIAAFALVFFLKNGEKAITGSNIENGRTNEILLGREKYGIPSSVFSELPQAPKDFNNVVELYYAGKINAFYLSKSYYKQPEFLRNFQNSGLKEWLNPEKERWKVTGFGIQPALQAIALKQGSKARARMFISSGFGVRSFQGLRLEAELPEELKDSLRVEFSEQEFLLEPNFPRFGKEWIKAVSISFEANGSIPKGVYEVYFSIARPSLESRKEWGEKYAEFYFDAASFSSGKNVFKVFLSVE